MSGSSRVAWRSAEPPSATTTAGDRSRAARAARSAVAAMRLVLYQTKGRS